MLIDTMARLDEQIGKLNAEIARRAKENKVARRLLTIPGIGPLIATVFGRPRSATRDLPPGA